MSIPAACARHAIEVKVFVVSTESFARDPVKHLVFVLSVAAIVAYWRSSHFFPGRAKMVC